MTIAERDRPVKSLALALHLPAVFVIVPSLLVHR